MKEHDNYIILETYRYTEFLPFPQNLEARDKWYHIKYLDSTGQNEWSDTTAI